MLTKTRMDGQAGLRDGQVGEHTVPTYGLLEAGQIAPLAAAELELGLQLAQGLELPLDRVVCREVAWQCAEASQVADVLDIVQCGETRGEGQLGARGEAGLVAGAGPGRVVGQGRLFLEAGQSRLPLLTLAAPVGPGLDREFGLTELGQGVLPLEQKGASDAQWWGEPNRQQQRLRRDTGCTTHRDWTQPHA